MRYAKFQNVITGEECIVDTYVSRYRRLCMGFLNTLKLQPRFLKHLTLTQRVESYKPNILNHFFCSLRRYYGDVVYIWTAEVQEERAERYGERVLHWHVLVGFKYDIKFSKEDIRRLQLYWKYGNLDCKPVRRPGLSYLMKYISKALGVDVGFGVRRIGSSYISAFLRRSWSKLVDAISFFLGKGESIDSLSKNYEWNWRGAFVRIGFRERLWCYVHPKTNWRFVMSFDDAALSGLSF